MNQGCIWAGPFSRSKGEDAVRKPRHYCKDGMRREQHEHTSFTFLGFTFRQRKAHNRTTGKHFLGFQPAMNSEAKKAKGTQLRRLALHRQTNLTMDDLARRLNPVVRGWMQYYERFYRTEMWPLLGRVSTCLMRWARAKYRRLRADKGFRRWWQGVQQRSPLLFAHWTWVRTY